MTPPAPVRFCLYVSGESANSLLAVANLTALCERCLAGRHEIEVVNVLTDPDRALAASVFLTPTLVKLSPEPGRRIVGNLSRTQTVMDTLGLVAAAA